MLLKNKIFNLNIIREKFIIPFGFMFFVVSIIFYLLQLQTGSLINKNIILLTSLIVGYISFIFWYRKHYSKISNIIITSFSSIILLGTLIWLAIAKPENIAEYYFFYISNIFILIISLLSCHLYFFVFKINLESKNNNNLLMDNKTDISTKEYGNFLYFKTFFIDNIYYIIPLLFIMIAGSFFRLWQLGLDNLWVDEIWHIYSSYNGIIQHSFLYTLQIYNSAPLTTFITYVSIYFFGIVQDFYLRLPFVLIGILTIPLAYLVGYKFQNKLTGLIFALLTSLSPVLIIHSRDIRFYILIIFFELLILFFYFTYLNTSNIKYLRNILFIVVISIISGPYYFLILLPFLILNLVYINRHFILKKFNKIALFILILLIIVFLGLIFIQFSWIIDKQPQYSHFFYINNIFIYEFLYILIAIVGLVLSFKKTWYLILFFTSSLFLVSFLPLQNERYILFLIPVLYLITASTVTSLYEIIPKHKKVFRFIFMLLIIMVPIYNLSKFNLYATLSLEEKTNIESTPNNLKNLTVYFSTISQSLIRSPNYVKPNYRDAVAYISKIAKKSKIIIIGGDPQTLRYYNKIYYKTDFMIIHPDTNFDIINDIITKNSDAEIYAIESQEIYLNDKNKKMDSRTLYFVLNKMIRIENFNSIAVYKLNTE